MPLSIQTSSNREWRTSFQRILPQGDDSHRNSVLIAFAKGVAWADEHKIPHKRDATHYTAQYMRTLAHGAPIIPQFMRAYCAYLLNIVPLEGKIWESSSALPSQVPRPAQAPPTVALA